MKLTIENLKKCLSEIGYEVKGQKPNRFIYDHKGHNTGARVWNETIEFKTDSGLTTTAVMGRCTINVMKKDTVIIGNQKLFVLFHNFDNK